MNLGATNGGVIPPPAAFKKQHIRLVGVKQQEPGITTATAATATTATPWTATATVQQ